VGSSRGSVVRGVAGADVQAGGRCGAGGAGARRRLGRHRRSCPIGARAPGVRLRDHPPRPGRRWHPTRRGADPTDVRQGAAQGGPRSDRHFQWPGCTPRASSCEVDHIDRYSSGGPTSLANGLTLCSFHAPRSAPPAHDHRAPAGRDQVRPTRRHRPWHHQRRDRREEAAAPRACGPGSRGLATLPRRRQAPRRHDPTRASKAAHEGLAPASPAPTTPGARRLVRARRGGRGPGSGAPGRPGRRASFRP
jgi:hypothetical protein